MTDPFNPGCGYACPEGRVDAVTLSHHHHDHDYTELLTGFKTFDTEITAKYKGFEISSVMAFHDECGGAKRGSNLLFKICADGQTAVHLGDLGHFPDEKQLEFIYGADVLLIPIGGFYTVDTDTAIRIINEARPKAAVAMHFKAGDNQFPISDAAEFIRRTDAVQVGHIEQIADLHGCAIMKYA